MCNQRVFFAIFFTGKERDSESNLDNFGARYDTSSLGRFMTPDDGSDQAASDPQSWNLYSYVRNNPLINVDPDGHGCALYLQYYVDDDGAKRAAGVEGYFCTDTFIRFTQNLWDSTRNFITAPRDQNCMAAAETKGAAVGTGAGLVAGGILGVETGPGAVFTSAGGGAVGGPAGGLAGGIGGLFTCMTGSGSGGGSGSSSGNRLTNKEAKEAAKKLGYDQEVKNPPFNSHGNKVFTNGKNYITADRDMHSGGVWKMFNSSGDRLGTYDANLNRIGN